ncbi:MAG: NUDIX domain-containing protein [Geothermobacteraceae bacterium]
MSIQDDIFDIVDEEDRVIGQAPRSKCHGNPNLIHRVAHVLVFDSRDRLLLQKRHPRKDIQPDKWDTSVGGHLEPGENYLDAARREMAEELGIIGVPLTFLYKSKIRNEVESENVATYLARWDGPIEFNPAEITEIRYWTRDEIEAAIGNGVFTPNFEEEWLMYVRWCRRYPTRTGSAVALCAGDSFPDIVLSEDVVHKK